MYSALLSGQRMNLTTHLYLVVNLRMCDASHSRLHPYGAELKHSNNFIFTFKCSKRETLVISSHPS